jgi:hypothetical protein
MGRQQRWGLALAGERPCLLIPNGSIERSLLRRIWPQCVS